VMKPRDFVVQMQTLDWPMDECGLLLITCCISIHPFVLYEAYASSARTFSKRSDALVPHVPSWIRAERLVVLESGEAEQIQGKLVILRGRGRSERNISVFMSRI
jgi:hypothetical protein